MKEQKRLLALAMAAVLIIGLMPGITAEAAKKKVYVLTQIYHDNYDPSGTESWGTWTENISYEKNGLVKRISEGSSGGTVFKYDDDGKIISIKQRGGYYIEKLEYDSKGRVKEMTRSTKETNATQQYLFISNGNGLITKEKDCFIQNKKTEFSSTTTFSYDSFDRIKQSKKDGSEPTVYQYDEKGNLSGYLVNDNVAYMDGTVETNSYINTYQGNRLASREFISNVAAGKSFANYRYKQISVDKDLAKTIEAQQWMLLNEYLNNVPLLSIMGE